ncbi:MAG: hypothetical protein BRC29_04470 [Nanohaloarchaea archaeon SW_7_43_1]|nr:MAG: hypothetical protein BRC29_04470 [Nanohaloarchaea archaeon SW_7_43_1]
MASSDREEEQRSRREVLGLNLGHVEDKEVFEEDVNPYSRREFLQHMKKLSYLSLGGYSADTTVNIWRQMSINEFEPFDPQDHFHEQGIDAFLDGETPAIELYVVGSDTFGDVQLMTSEYEKVLEREANTLSNQGILGIETNYVHDTEIQNQVESSTVKELNSADDEAMESIENFLKEEYNAEVNNFHVLVGDFETGWGDYKGSYIGESYSAVCNTRTDKYVCNQVLHQIGHMFGAPHSAFMSFNDQMSWSPLKEIRAHLDIVPYGVETKHKVEENLNKRSSKDEII